MGQHIERLSKTCKCLSSYTAKLNADDQSDETKRFAVGMWANWPVWKEVIQSTAELARNTESADEEEWTTVADGELLTCHPQSSRQQLAFAFESAVRWMMRAGARSGFDVTCLAKCQTYVCHLIMRDAHLNPGGHADTWPGVLGSELQSLPESQQAAVIESTAAYERLLAFLEVKMESQCQISVMDIGALLREKGCRKSESTIRSWTSKNDFPQPCSSGRPVRYELESVKHWLLVSQGISI